MMRPEELVGAIARRWWIIAIAVVVAALVGFAGTSSRPKTYTVSTRLMAVADPPDYWLDLYAKNRLASYKDLIGNWEFIAEALQQAELNVDPGVAQSKLTLGHNPDSNIVQIVVTDTDPRRSADIANALGDAFVKRNEIDNAALRERPRPADTGEPGVVQMLKLDTPAAPTVASGPRVKVNTLASAVLGGVVGLTIVFATIYLDDTLKTPIDLERYLDMPLLATVSGEERGG